MKNAGIEAIYHRYANDVYLYALALCKNHHLAEELTSDTFYKALLSMDGGSPHIKYWLLRVCKNSFLDTCRKKRREPASLVESLTVDIAGADTPLEAILKNEARQTLYRALLRLSPAEREVLTLFYFLDCSVLQIATQTGRTLGAVKTALSRARARLKHQLEEQR